MLTAIINGAIKVVIAVVILLVAFAIIKRLVAALKKFCDKKNLDATINKVLMHVVEWGAKIIVIISLLGYVGIDTAGIAALIASLGLGVGLAVQGSLANFAGGILIILLRPLRIGDFIEAQGISGTVEDISIFYTYITTPDNKSVCIPNGALANGNIVNYSKKDIRRVDFAFSISYAEDFVRAQKAILEVCNAHELVLKDKDVTCRMSAHADSAIVVTTRVWVNSADYWTVNFDILEQVKAKFDAEKIEIPFNQIDVHIDNK
ncbi:MAG: mechanosensitive ion channel [Clostridia bacterium]|nr:mechanosensitive ion channel [Clostridia bacterium]